MSQLWIPCLDDVDVVEHEHVNVDENIRIDEGIDEANNDATQGEKIEGYTNIKLVPNVND